MAELSYKEMSKYFREAPEPFSVKFNTCKRTDRQASVDAGHRVEHKVPFITRFYPDVKDRISRPARAEQIAKYREEFAFYEEQIRRGNEENYDRRPGLSGDATGRSNGSGQEDCAIPFQAKGG